MKYILAIILMFVVYIISYTLLLPHLLMSFKFKELNKALNNFSNDLEDYINN